MPKVENRIKIVRNNLGGISQAKLADILKIPTYKIKYAETADAKISHEIARALEEKLGYCFAWTITGDGPMKKRDVSPATPSMHEDVQSLADPPRHPAAALIPAPDSGPPGIDPAVQAMADIKEIFDSGDPILVPAIQANLNAFKRALQRERQFAMVLKENQEIKKENQEIKEGIVDIKKQLESLKAENLELRREVNRLKATYEGHDGGDGDLATDKQAM
jgi:hypothetical protein